jgi:hypothetical protein
MESSGVGLPQQHDLSFVRAKLLALQFLDSVDVLDRDVWRYLERQGIDLDAVEAAGPIGRFRVAFDDYGTFERNDSGEDALVHLINDVDGETPVDLIAWSLVHPHRFATYLGVGGMLGADHALVPKCHLLPTPLAWLRAGCWGACILDSEAAADILHSASGPFIAQDIVHAHELIRMLPGIFKKRGRLLVAREREHERA